jgi:hypothetical protein
VAAAVRHGTLASAAAKKVATLAIPERALAQAGPAAAVAEGDKSFFRTPAGVATIVLMAVGTGYMIHSAFKDNDPVHSPFR